MPKLFHSKINPGGKILLNLGEKTLGKSAYWYKIRPLLVMEKKKKEGRIVC